MARMRWNDTARRYQYSGKLLASLYRRTTQELFRRHRLLAGALHMQQPDRTVAAGHGQTVIDGLTGRAAPLGARAAQHLDTYAAEFEPRAGKWRQAANAVVHRARRFRPVDARFIF